MPARRSRKFGVLWRYAGRSQERWPTHCAGLRIYGNPVGDVSNASDFRWAHLVESGLLFHWAGAAAGGAVSGSLFQPDLIVDCLAQPQLAAQVSLRGLHRNVAQQELNLLQFAARRMT